MARHLLILGFIAGLWLLLSFFPEQAATRTFHSEAELEYFRTHMLLNPPPPVDTNLMFPPASSCAGCHGFDPNGFAMVDAAGNDVNVFDNWESTMMANAAKDPFWRAKVSHEVLENPQHQEAIETVCTSCHAPMGHYTEILRGAAHYTMEDLLMDTIGLEGVSCGACHQISTENLGLTFSGQLTYDTTRVLYGPYDLPFAAPMVEFVGFEPLFSEHINDAGICAPCHTLLVSTLDLEGNLTGETFVEQATYHEWLNSEYAENEVSCQSCHMPRLEEPVVISSGYLFLEGRSPYGQHELVGANSFMLELMKENRQALDLSATEAQFEETIAKTLEMLQQQTLDVSLEPLGQEQDTFIFELMLENKAGHKFPSGYPSRRAFVECLVISESGDTLFHSGRVLPDGEVAGLDPVYEPHYTIIRTDEQVQIYEQVVADVDGNFTTVLERAAYSLKDNRLPPIGFSTDHEVYDTTLIVGEALLDPDFNRIDGMEGTGADRIRFHLGLNGYEGLLSVQARVHYQSLPPRWLAPMFAESTPEIDSFRNMFDAMDNTPVVIAEVNLEDYYVDGGTSTNEQMEPPFSIYPNPAAPGWIRLDIPFDLQMREIRVFDAAGKLLREDPGSVRQIRIEHPGIYLVQIETKSGVFTKKVLVQD